MADRQTLRNQQDPGRFEIEHVEGPDGEPCGHVTVGEDEAHADMMHLYHCLNDHDLSEEVESIVRERLAELEGGDGDEC